MQEADMSKQLGTAQLQPTDQLQIMTSYPRGQIPFCPEHALCGEGSLVLQEVHRRFEPHHFVQPTVFPSHEDYETEQHQADAEAVISGQIHRKESTEAFPEGPEHGDSAISGAPLARGGWGRKRLASVHNGLCVHGWHRSHSFTSYN